MLRASHNDPGKLTQREKTPLVPGGERRIPPLCAWKRRLAQLLAPRNRQLQDRSTLRFSCWNVQELGLAILID